MATKKRNRVDSRAHTPCPHCRFKLHGERGLAMHLKQMHGVEPKTPAPAERMDRLMGRAS